MNIKKAFILLTYCLFSYGILFAQTFLSKEKIDDPKYFIYTDFTENPENVESKEGNFLRNSSSNILERESFPFDYESIYKILILLQENENKLAIKILNHFDEISSDLEDEKEQLEELKLFFETKAFFQDQEYSKAIFKSKKYLDEYPDNSHFSVVLFYYLLSLSKEHLPLDHLTFVTDELIRNLFPEQQLELRKTLSDHYFSEKSYFTAIDYLKNSRKRTIPQFQKKALEIIKYIDDHDDLDDLIAESVNSDILFKLYHKKIELLIQQRDFSSADDVLSNLDNTPEKIDIIGIQNSFRLKKLVNVFKNTSPYKLGVILPFSHRKYSVLANQVLEGIEMALRELFKIQKIELILKDSKLNDEETRKVTKELIEDDYVIGILGPLSRKNSIAAGEVAAFYKTPVISFSLTEEVGKGSSVLFRYQRNKKVEAEEIAKYAIDYLQAKKFLVFYSDSKSSKIKKNYFTQEIERRGGEIVGAYGVKKGQVDYQDAFKQMTGAFRYLVDKKLSISLGKEKDKIEPILDFDAIYIPERAQRVKFISSFARSVDAYNVWLLGGSELNASSSYLLLGQKNLRFIDTFNLGQSSTKLQKFYEKHWKMYMHKSRYTRPSSYTLYAFEIMQILIDLLNQPDNHDREVLIQKLAQINQQKVLSGKVNSKENNEILKEIKILTLENGKIVPVL